MLGLVEPPGLTILSSTLPHGTATSLIWSGQLSKQFVCFPTKVGVLLGYILHHTRGKAVKVDPVVNVVLWQVNQLNQSQSYPPDLLPCFLCCRLWSARLEIWWSDHTFHGNCLQRFAGEELCITKVNLFQRLAWGFSLAWVIFSCTKVAIESSI